MLLLILGLVLFVLLVVIHEYGHFLVAKRNGVEVEEFGIGFPPKIYGRKLGKGIFEGYYTINALPLGGFVKLKGENDADKRHGAFGSVSTKAKLKIMLAGVAMNLIAALILFTIVAWVGMPQLIPDQFSVASDSKLIRSDVIASQVEQDSPAQKAGISAGSTILEFAGNNITEQEQLQVLTIKNAGTTVPVSFSDKNGIKQTDLVLPSVQEVKIDKVEPGSPADIAGIKNGSTIVSVNGLKIVSKDQLPELTKEFAGQTVKIELVSDGNKQIKDVKLLSRQEVEDSLNSTSPKGYLGIITTGNLLSGIIPYEYKLERSTWSAPVVAIGLSAQITGLTVKALGVALANLGQAVFSLITLNPSEAKQEASKASENVSGPLGIFAILRQGGDLGYQFTLFVVAILSLTLAIMNFLPIPALDGGRAFVMLLFRGLKKPLTPELEDKIHGTGFAILMLLFIVITFVDYNRFF